MRLRSLRLLVLAVLPLLVAGCDDAASNLFTFTVDNVSFTFSFRNDQVDGTAVQQTSQNTENILAAIEAQGFGAADVSSVRLVDGSAQIRFLNSPTGASIGVLDDVSVRLEAGGTSTEVASAENIESGTSMMNEASLETSNANIADIVTAGDFRALLDVSGDPGLPAGTYRVEVFFDVNVDVQSF